MGIATIYTCDRCNKELNLKGNANEFCQTKAVLIEGELSHSGFLGEGSKTGYDQSDFKLLVCKGCYEGIRSKLCSALGITMMLNQKSED